MPVLCRWDEDDDQPGRRQSGAWRYDETSESSDNSSANSTSGFLGMKLRMVYYGFVYQTH